MKTSKTIRVLLCDDHRIVREGLKQILADTHDIVVARDCDCGADAVQALRDAAVPGRDPFDVLLLDIAMPKRDGLDVLMQVRRELPRLPVVMLSTYPDDQYAARCFRLGASGYLNKSADPDALIAAIRKTAGGGLYVGSAMGEHLAAQLARSPERLPHELFSNREDQVFRLLVTGATVGQIADHLVLSPNTVSTYRTRVLEKTGAGNDVALALYAVRHELLPV